MLLDAVAAVRLMLMCNQVGETNTTTIFPVPTSFVLRHVLIQQELFGDNV